MTNSDAPSGPVETAPQFPVDPPDRKGLMPHQTYWLDEDDHRWLVNAWLGRVGDRIEVVGMEVRSFRLEKEALLEPMLPAQDEAVKLTSAVWRSTGALKKQLRENYRDGLEGLLDYADPDVAAAWREPNQQPTPSQQVPTTHQKIADMHDAARSLGKRPALEISRRLDISVSAANKRIARARNAGFLPPAKPGRPKGNSNEDDLPGGHGQATEA